MTNVADVGSAVNAVHPKGAIREALERSPAVEPVSASMTVTLCFGAVLFDGLDTSSIGVAGPSIAAHLNASAGSLTAPFVATSFGAVIGYLAAGSLVARWGARRILIASVLLFGALSLATPLAGSITQLAALRLVTAIGLGVALPSAISIAVARCTLRLRAAVTVIVGTGLAAGGVLGGMLGGALISRFGWQILFYVGGALPLFLALLLLRWLPQPGEFDASQVAVSGNRDRGYVQSIGDLLVGERTIPTLSLWTFSFLIFADAYALLFWLPVLLVGLGFPLEYSQLCVGFFSAGGLVANVIVMVLVERIAIARVMLSAACLVVVSVAALSVHMILPVGVWVPVVGVGAGLIACSVGQSALAVFIYPESLRTNGVGFSAAAGRIGSIVGPVIAGLLISMSVAPRLIVLSTALPALLAVCVLLLLVRHAQRQYQ